MSVESFILNNGTVEEIEAYRQNKEMNARRANAIRVALSHLAYALDTPRKRDIAIRALHFSIFLDRPSKPKFITENDLLDIIVIQDALEEVQAAFFRQYALQRRNELPGDYFYDLADIAVRFGSLHNARLAESVIFRYDDGYLDGIDQDNVGIVEWDYMCGLAGAVGTFLYDLQSGAEVMKANDAAEAKALKAEKEAAAKAKGKEVAE